MPEEIELLTEEGLLKDKYHNFLKKNKKIILVIVFFMIFIPISYQVFSFLKKKHYERLYADYLKAELMFESNKKKSLELLNDLKNQDNPTIKILSSMKLGEHYIILGDNKKLSIIYEDLKKNIKEPLLKDLIFSKDLILNFDNLNEEQILKYKIKKENHFKRIKNKLFYDFYIKTNQKNKADQILNIQN